MPCLAKKPLSLATNSAPASVSAMKPSLAPFTSGPAPCANAPPGNCVCTAPSSAAVLAVPLRNLRRSIDFRPVSFVVIVFVVLSGLVSLRPPSRFPCVSFANKKAAACKWAFIGLLQVSGVACRPVVGPRCRHGRHRLGLDQFKLRARSPIGGFIEMRQRLTAEIGKPLTNRKLMPPCPSWPHPADNLCSAKNRQSAIAGSATPQCDSSMSFGSNGGPVNAPMPSTGSPAMSRALARQRGIVEVGPKHRLRSSEHLARKRRLTPAHHLCVEPGRLWVGPALRPTADSGRCAMAVGRHLQAAVERPADDFAERRCVRPPGSPPPRRGSPGLDNGGKTERGSAAAACRGFQPTSSPAPRAPSRGAAGIRTRSAGCSRCRDRPRPSSTARRRRTRRRACWRGFRPCRRQHDHAHVVVGSTPPPPSRTADGSCASRTKGHAEGQRVLLRLAVRPRGPARGRHRIGDVAVGRGGKRRIEFRRHRDGIAVHAEAERRDDRHLDVAEPRLERSPPARSDAPHRTSRC